MAKKELTKAKKSEPVRAATTIATPVLADAPELVIQRASNKGVSVVVRNVRLTWVFVSSWREDKTDWRKATKSVTLLIPKKTARQFQTQLADAVKQCLQLSNVASADRATIAKTALAVNVAGSLLKDGDESRDPAGLPRPELAGHLTWQIKTTALRETRDAEFTSRISLVLQDAAGRAIEPAFVDRELYSGVYADVAATLVVYDVNGNKGITTYLNGLRKVRDAERLAQYNPFAGLPPAASAPDNDVIPF